MKLTDTVDKVTEIWLLVWDSACSRRLEVKLVMAEHMPFLSSLLQLQFAYRCPSLCHRKRKRLSSLQKSEKSIRHGCQLSLVSGCTSSCPFERCPQRDQCQWRGNKVTTFAEISYDEEGDRGMKTDIVTLNIRLGSRSSTSNASNFHKWNT